MFRYGWPWWPYYACCFFDSLGSIQAILSGVPPDSPACITNIELAPTISEAYALIDDKSTSNTCTTSSLSSFDSCIRSVRAYPSRSRAFTIAFGVFVLKAASMLFEMPWNG